MFRNFPTKKKIFRAQNFPKFFWIYVFFFVVMVLIKKNFEFFVLKNIFFRKLSGSFIYLILSCLIRPVAHIFGFGTIEFHLFLTFFSECDEASTRPASV